MLQNLRSTQPHNNVAFADGSTCSPECSRYKGTFDVFYKVTHQASFYKEDVIIKMFVMIGVRAYGLVVQEGFSRLWRGTNASLALAIPTVSVFCQRAKKFSTEDNLLHLVIAVQVGIYLPCYDILRDFLEERTEEYASSLSPYSPLVAGSAARMLACITCYPIELARTRMQAFKETQASIKPPGVWTTMREVVSPVRNANHFHELQNYRVLWTGLGAQLARDIPFSAICWGTLEPIRRSIISLTGDDTNAAKVLGANFAGGFAAGTLAAAATCPLDVARTRRQIENDPVRQMRMTTRHTLMEIWRKNIAKPLSTELIYSIYAYDEHLTSSDDFSLRICRDGGWKGLFTGVSPRVARAGPSVGIVISSYELMKYALYHRHLTGE
ncbi:Mitochondrial carrier protein MTM1 [Bienertia sinuspersici]